MPPLCSKSQDFFLSLHPKIKNMNKELPKSYDAAMDELQQLVARLQDSDCKVDQICDLTQRATQLLKYCREKLTQVDTQLAQLLKDLDNE